MPVGSEITESGLDAMALGWACKSIIGGWVQRRGVIKARRLVGSPRK